MAGFDRQERFVSSTGADLKIYTGTADGKPRGIVQIHHGLSEHAGRYGEFAGFLLSRGYHVIAHDHRGHGGTRAPDAVQGQFAEKDGVRKVVQDALDVAGMRRAQHPGLPLILFGHSMGSLVAMSTAQQLGSDLSALALWNGNFSSGPAAWSARLILKIERMRRGSDTPSPIMQALTLDQWARSIRGHRTNFDWLSHDAGEVAAYIADPLCGFDPTISLWRDLFTLMADGLDRTRLASLSTTLPIHLAGGGKDPATNNGKAVTALARYLRGAGFTDVTGRVYETLRHETLKERPHDRRGAMEDFTAWLSRLGKIKLPPSLR